MINKTDLHGIIHKYYLNNRVETTKWVIKDDTLTINFEDVSRSFIGDLTYHNIDIQDMELGLGNATRFLKLLAILNGELFIDFVKTQGIVEKLIIDDSQFNIKYALYDPESIPPVAKLGGYPDMDLEMKLETDDIDALLRANTALSECNEFGIEPSKNLDDEDIVNFMFGENSAHSNKITYSVRADIKNNFGKQFRFDTSLFKDILNANKKSEESTLRFSTTGLLHYNFKGENYEVNYYTNPKA